MGGPSKLHVLRLVSVLFLMAAADVSAQGLVSVPDTMTHDLNAYYLSKLGRDLDYYSVLTGRNVLNTNVYNLVNGLPDNTNPVEAAALTSVVRGEYTSNGIGGKVLVNIYYKLVRCADPATCQYFERVIVTNSQGASQPQEILAVLKGGFASNSWLINANQSAANLILNQPGALERAHTDETYSKSKLFYKVVPAPAPCSSTKPQTILGPIGEFEGVPQFACIQYNGTFMLLATDTGAGIAAMSVYGVDSRLCDGSLAAFYTTDSDNNVGSRIIALVQRPQAVPLYLKIVLPYSIACELDNTVALTLRTAVALAKEAVTFTGTSPNNNLKVPTSVQNLGLKGDCTPLLYYSGYGFFTAGQVNAIKENTAANETFHLVEDNSAALCSSPIDSNSVIGRNTDEDACAQWFSGDLEQRREAVITYNGLKSTGPITASDIDDLNSTCFNSYSLGVSNILPQIAIDFEADRVSLLSSTEVKIHMDAVAANAASIVALEIALASSGIVVARMIARSGFYRRQRISSTLARLVACLVTTFAITIFNVPNFALIVKSLQNHDAGKTFTTVSTRQYQPSNFSAFVLAETHAFVEVRGSSATAVIGLLLYAAALLFSIYITWGEFTEIIKRKNEAARCLGHEALVADKDLLIEWRGTDSKLHDILHPTAVKETGLAAEVELMRRAVARKQLETQPNGQVNNFETGGSFERGHHGIPSPRTGLGSPRGPYRYQGVESPRDVHPGHPPPV